MSEKKIDFLGTAFIMAIIATLMSDFAFLFLLALLIPIIGLIIALMVIMFHYFVGFLLLFLIFPSLKHLIPKLTLILFIILPLPFLTIGMVLAIILQNRIIEFIVTQTVITVATGGVGTAVSAGVAAARAGGAIAKGAEVAAGVTRAGTLGAKAISVEKEAALGAKTAGVETTSVEKARAGSAEREGVPKQQEDSFEDKMRARKEKLNKIVEKIHEKEDRDKVKKSKEFGEKEEE